MAAWITRLARGKRLVVLLSAPVLLVLTTAVAIRTVPVIEATDPGTQVLSASERRALTPPTFTRVPQDPAASEDTTFAWAHPNASVTFTCQVDQRAWTGCSSPYRFLVDGTSNSQHRFSVRAVSGAAMSDPTTFRWKLATFSFGVSASLGTLAPGVWRPINVTLTNPHNFPIYVESLAVGVSDAPSACPASPNLEISQSGASRTQPIRIGARSSAVVPEALRPAIRLRNLSTNQDACKGAAFKLSYSGVAFK